MLKNIKQNTNGPDMKNKIDNARAVLNGSDKATQQKNKEANNSNHGHTANPTPRQLVVPPKPLQHNAEPPVKPILKPSTPSIPQTPQKPVFKSPVQPPHIQTPHLLPPHMQPQHIQTPHLLPSNLQAPAKKVNFVPIQDNVIGSSIKYQPVRPNNFVPQTPVNKVNNVPSLKKNVQFMNRTKASSSSFLSSISNAFKKIVPVISQNAVPTIGKIVKTIGTITKEVQASGVDVNSLVTDLSGSVDAITRSVTNGYNRGVNPGLGTETKILANAAYDVVGKVQKFLSNTLGINFAQSRLPMLTSHFPRTETGELDHEKCWNIIKERFPATEEDGDLDNWDNFDSEDNETSNDDNELDDNDKKALADIQSNLNAQNSVSMKKTTSSGSSNSKLGPLSFIFNKLASYLSPAVAKVVHKVLADFTLVVDNIKTKGFHVSSLLKELESMTLGIESMLSNVPVSGSAKTVVNDISVAVETLHNILISFSGFISKSPALTHLSNNLPLSKAHFVGKDEDIDHEKSWNKIKEKYNNVDLMHTAKASAPAPQNPSSYILSLGSVLKHILPYVSPKIGNTVQKVMKEFDLVSDQLKQNSGLDVNLLISGIESYVLGLIRGVKQAQNNGSNAVTNEGISVSVNAIYALVKALEGFISSSSQNSNGSVPPVPLSTYHFSFNGDSEDDIDCEDSWKMIESKFGDSSKSNSVQVLNQASLTVSEAANYFNSFVQIFGKLKPYLSQNNANTVQNIINYLSSILNNLNNNNVDIGTLVMEIQGLVMGLVSGVKTKIKKGNIWGISEEIKLAVNAIYGIVSKFQQYSNNNSPLMNLAQTHFPHNNGKLDHEQAWKMLQSKFGK